MWTKHVSRLHQVVLMPSLCRVFAKLCHHAALILLLFCRVFASRCCWTHCYIGIWCLKFCIWSFLAWGRHKKKKMMASVAFFCPEAVATRVLQHKRVAKYDACISTEFARLLCQWRKLTCTKTKWKVLQTFSNVTKLLFSNEKWVILAVSATLSRGVRMHSNTSQIAFDVAFYFQLIFALPCSMPELCRTA